MDSISLTGLQWNNLSWHVGEEVLIWSIREKTTYTGTVYGIEAPQYVKNPTEGILKILVNSNGKIYNYYLDGCAIDPRGSTNRRVFSVRELNEVKSL